MTETMKLYPKQKRAIIIAYLMMIILSSFIASSIATFIMQILLFIITLPFLLNSNYKMAKLYIIIFYLSILFVFLVYIGNEAYYGKPYYIGGSDDLQFEEQGKIVYNADLYTPKTVLESKIIGEYNSSPYFAVYISILMRFSDFFDGYSTFMPRIANIYYLIWICMILNHIFNKYFSLSSKKNFYITAGFALMPNIQYINSHVFRDTFNLLQMILIIHLFNVIITNKNLYYRLLSLIALPFLVFITYYTRTSSLVFPAVIIFLYTAKHLVDRYNIEKKYILISIISLIVITYVLNLFNLSYYIKTYTNYVLNIAGDGLSRFVFSPPLLPFGVFLRALYAFITPFPNFFTLFNNSQQLIIDIIRMLIYFGVVVQILFIPFIIKRIIKFDLLSLSFLSWFLAVIITTFTFRHVIMYYPFMVAVAVDGYFDTTKKDRKIILCLSGVIAFCLGLLYIKLKSFI